MPDLVRLRNVSGTDLEVDFLGATVEVKAGATVEFAGRPATRDDLAEHLGVEAPTWPDDALHIHVERAGHVLAFPTAIWAVDAPAKTKES